MNLISQSDLAAIQLPLILSLEAIFLLMAGIFSKDQLGKWIGHLTLLFLLVPLYFEISGLNGSAIVGFNGSVISDDTSTFFNIIFLICGIFTTLLSLSYLPREGFDHFEFYPLLLFAIVGMIFMASGTNLMVLFLGLETMSIAVYILAAFRRTQASSIESAMKYFLLGAFASGFLLYGMALIYGVTGSTDLMKIQEFFLQNSSANSPLAWIGVGLLVVGFGFKVAFVPFHMWTPDVYQGAPTPITGFMAAGVKAAAFAAFGRVFFTSVTSLYTEWNGLLVILAVLTMTTGNIIAIAQKNMKRMLAYSSIAHAGYISMALIASNEFAAAGMQFYLLAYTFMTIGAFAVVMAVEPKEGERTQIDDYAGLSTRHPYRAFVLAVCLLSLAGIPPTAGFVAKFYVFSAAVKAGYIGLVVVGVLNSAISMYYYLRPIGQMYFFPPNTDTGERKLPWGVFVVMTLSLWAVLQMGITPRWFYQTIETLGYALIK
jgi:NADH-quinone oxidoreductase subunit N